MSLKDENYAPYNCVRNIIIVSSPYFLFCLFCYAIHSVLYTFFGASVAYKVVRKFTHWCWATYCYWFNHIEFFKRIPWISIDDTVSSCGLNRPAPVKNMTKPTKGHMRPAKTQISLGTHPVWSETSLCSLRVAKDLSPCFKSQAFKLHTTLVDTT